jgi:pyruvate formate lyase activating enzyme
MILKGLQKLTLLDYPGEIAATVFTGGCNFRCPFCHNASLVLPEKFGATLPTEEFFAFLESRRGKLRAVCVSGGEPTMQGDLREFIARIKEMGFLVKLDTNGTRPDVLRALMDGGLLDYVAMDIKNSKARYGETVGVKNFDISPIEESINILRKGNVPFEFRTTVVRELHDAQDFAEIGEWLSGDEKFFLQTFEDSGDLIGAGYTAYGEEEMKSFLEILKGYVPNAALR